MDERQPAVHEPPRLSNLLVAKHRSTSRVDSLRLAPTTSARLLDFIRNLLIPTRLRAYTRCCRAAPARANAFSLRLNAPTPVGFSDPALLVVVGRHF